MALPWIALVLKQGPGYQGEVWKARTPSVQSYGMKVKPKCPALLIMHFLWANVKAATPPASALMSCHLEQLRTCQPRLLSFAQAQDIVEISGKGDFSKLEDNQLLSKPSTFSTPKQTLFPVSQPLIESLSHEILSKTLLIYKMILHSSVKTCPTHKKCSGGKVVEYNSLILHLTEVCARHIHDNSETSLAWLYSIDVQKHQTYSFAFSCQSCSNCRP